jgi:hypothetical protein
MAVNEIGFLLARLVQFAEILIAAGAVLTRQLNAPVRIIDQLPYREGSFVTIIGIGPPAWTPVT